MKTPIQKFIKTAICIVLISSFNQSKCQDLLSSYQQLFNNFDSTQLNTSFLLDKCPNYSGYNESWHHTDTLHSDIEHWNQTYLDLYNSKFAQPGLLPPSSIMSLVGQFRNNNIQPIGIILKEVNQIKDSAYINGQISFDSLSGELDFTNFNYSELKSINIFDVGAMVPFVENDTLRIVFDENFIIADQGISSFAITIPQINFQAETPINQLVEIPINALFPDQLNIYAYITFVYNNTIYTGNIQFKRYLPIDNPDQTIYNFNVPNACQFNAPEGYGTARAHVLFSDPNKTQITKPLILVEGYDPSSMDYGAIGWRTLSTGISIDEFGNSVYPQLIKMPDMATALTNDGYDIIMVDFKSSGESIMKNAAALAKIIQWVNFTKTTSNEIVLLGASMGGLISQAALNILNGSDCPSCIQSFVSFDSPFKGANVPLGIQELVKFARPISSSIAHKYNYHLNTTAAKQMLFYHIDENGERNNWLNTYGTFNKHLASFNFCITSGKPNGSSIPINDGDLILEWKIYNSINISTVYVDLKVFSMNRYNNMLLQSKLPVQPRNVVIPFLGPQTIGVKSSISTTEYTLPKYQGEINYDYSVGSKAEYINDIFLKILEINQHLNSNFTAKVGPYMPKGGDHCFVPTTSALDLPPNTNNLSAINSIPPPDFTFDFVYFDSKNGPHVEINNDNIAFLTQTLKGISGTPNIGLLLNDFNVAGNRFHNFNSVTVFGGAHLSFNDYLKTNFGNLPTDYYSNILTIKANSSNCDAYINCLSGGEVVLGGNSPTNDQYKALVSFRKGSVLELQSDAVLRVREGSTLIIEEGATLIFHPGAKIYLEGENAVLDIRGTVQIEDGAVFGFEKGNANKGGYIRLQFGHTTSDHFRTMGTNCKIHLEGETWFQDKVLELAAYTDLFLPSSLYGNYPELNEFKIVNGHVSYTNEGKIDAACPVYLDHVTFDQNTNGTGVGLITHGQNNITLTHSTFNNFLIGYKAQNNDLGNNLSIQDNRFYQCANGIEVYGQEFSSSQGSISNCGIGLLLDGTANSTIDNVEFIYNSIGFHTQNSNNHVRFQNAWFYHNEFGIMDFEQTLMTIECTPFEYNLTGIQTNGKLNMSPNFRFTGQLLGGGHNTFFNNIDAGIQLNMSEIHLDGGENNFLTSNQPIVFYLFGSLMASPNYIPNNTLDVSGNYFDNLNTSGISGANGFLYSLQSFGGISPSAATVTLNGTTLGSMNTTCFNFPRVYPDFKAEVNYEAPEYSFESSESLQRIHIYPNPTTDVVQLEIESAVDQTCRIEIYDMQGKLILSEDLSLLAGLTRKQISLRNIADPGIYLLKLRNNNGQEQSVKINLSF